MGTQGLQLINLATQSFFPLLQLLHNYASNASTAEKQQLMGREGISSAIHLLYATTHNFQEHLQQSSQ